MELGNGMKWRGYGRKKNRGRLLFLGQKLKDMGGKWSLINEGSWLLEFLLVAWFVWLISEPTLPILLWLKVPLMGGEVAKFLANCLGFSRCNSIDLVPTV